MSNDGAIFCEDNLTTLARLPDNYIQLIYTDPPFGTGDVQQLNRIRNGAIIDNLSYNDIRTGKFYLDWLALRLREMHRVLTSDGSLYLHVDFRNVHHIRLLLDDIFGPENCINEIIWAYDYGGRPKDRWPKKHDNILWYVKDKRHWTFNYNNIDRIPYMAPGLVGPEKAAIGKLPTDVWWQTIVPTQGTERTGYPTQKPIQLAKRIILASSNPSQIVADFFCGSGTVGDAAQQLGRKYILSDESQEAIIITKTRMGLT